MIFHISCNRSSCGVGQETRSCQRSTLTTTVIIFNSLGDRSDGIVDVAKRLLAAVPYAKFFLPTAPMRKVTMNGGMEMLS